VAGGKWQRCAEERVKSGVRGEALKPLDKGRERGERRGGRRKGGGGGSSRCGGKALEEGAQWGYDEMGETRL